MPITFAADFDCKSLHHVSVRSRKNKEIELPPLPTAEDVARCANPELRFCTKASHWKPNYDDGVTERRDAEKTRMDEAARERLSVRPDTFLEGLSAVQVRPDRLISSDHRIIAEVIGSDPQDLRWSGNLYAMPASKILDIAVRCRESIDPAFAWNLNVRLHEPSIPSPMLAAPRTVWVDPARNSFHNMSTPRLTPRCSQNDLVTEWMRAAEQDQLPGRSTRCTLTGKSLVVRTNYFGRRSWRLESTFHGMSSEAAQQVASAVAIQAGLVRGVIRGTPPPLVERLRNNAQDWLGLVIATRHPVFCTIAAQLVSTGAAETLRFTENTEQNRYEWEQLIVATHMSNENIPDYRK